ncbi:zinc finger and BTB domain-containing protein 16-A-like [Bombus affinis]|nr:zinc finger and BTB domain-containing protein 16-A-like [Bombus affinis]
MAESQATEEPGSDGNEYSSKIQRSGNCLNDVVASGKMSENGLDEPSLGGNHANVRDTSSYSCSRCGNAYTRPHSLNRHIRFECGVEPQFECPICHKKSKHKHNLLLHMRTHQKP